MRAEVCLLPKQLGFFAQSYTTLLIVLLSSVAPVKKGWMSREEHGFTTFFISLGTVFP